MLSPIPLALALALQDPAPPAPVPPADSARLESALAEHGVRLDLQRGLCAVPAEVLVRDDYLEYLLVGAAGATHESLLVTDVPASLLNVALLALGLEPGENARWVPRDPPPTEEELRAGASAYDVEPPRGPGLFLHAAWREGEETYFFRVEDLVRDLSSGRSMRRHRWVYLGSRLVPDGRGGEEFAADLYQNLINVAFFSDGYTLATAALPECLQQTIWIANAWLLPERGSRVTLLLSRHRLDALPPEIEEGLTDVATGRPAAPGPDADR